MGTYTSGRTPGVFPARSKGARHLVPTLADGGCGTLCSHSPTAAVLPSEGAQSSVRMLVAHVTGSSKVRESFAGLGSWGFALARKGPSLVSALVPRLRPGSTGSAVGDLQQTSGTV